jgi:hypothetical protein
MNKTALDDAAKAYWKDYFKDYGASWVRDIPRKIKASLMANKRIAAKTAEATDDQVRPLAKHVAEDGSVTLEGVYKASNGTLLFVADFTPDGEVKALDALNI